MIQSFFLVEDLRDNGMKQHSATLRWRGGQSERAREEQRVCAMDSY